MKRLVSGFAILPVLLLGAGLAFAHGQQRPPRGSYMATCSNVEFDGQTLTATCQNTNGRRVKTSLGRADRCRRDIANINGALICM